MNVTELSLPGVKLIEPKIFSDHRGHFLETWNAQRYAEIGIGPFVQDNLSRSVRGTLRGLHLQNEPNAQGKLVHCVAGFFDGPDRTKIRNRHTVLLQALSHEHFV